MKVFDRKGNELTVGALVTHVPSGVPCKVVAVPDEPSRWSGGVEITVEDENGARGIYTAWLDPAEFVCDLLLIDSPTEGKEG